MTFRRTLLVGLIPTLSLGLWIGHLVSYTPEPTFATPIEIEEDGSARMTDGSVAPEGTYEWDCMTMGNRTCGPN